MDFFDKMAASVERQWRGYDYDERAFPAIAEAALVEFSPASHVKPAAVIDALLFEGALPLQSHDLAFGQPRIFVHAHPRFHIEVICWMDTTAYIHDHAFSGAFQVLAGSSVHSCFEFQRRERVNSEFVLGDVRLVRSELLRAGDTHTIVAGPAYIHGLFHLDSPSLTVVVRTGAVLDEMPHYNYLPPHVAHHPFVRANDRRQRRELLSMLIRTDRPEFLRVARRFMTEADLATVFEVLRFAHPHTVTRPVRLGAEDFASLAELARARLGERVELLLATVREATRVADITLRRSDVRRPEHRFFLALLMNVPNRRAILDLVAQQYGGDPVDTVQRWLRELTREERDGYVSLLDVELGFDDDMKAGPGEGGGTLLQAMTGWMLRGARDSALLEGLGAQLSPGFFAHVRDGVPELEATLRNGALHALFAD